MAERFQPYHVPQQSRRDKLRVTAQTRPRCVENDQEIANLVHLYDPSFLSSDLINCANVHHQRPNLGTAPCKQNSNVGTVSGSCGVKEKGMNLMGFVGGENTIPTAASPSSLATNHLYLDPQSSLQLSPGTIEDINGSPSIYTPQCLRVLDQSFHGNEVVVRKPESLSITHEANRSSAATCQGLSLSLSSHHTHQNNLPLELNLQRYDSSMFNSNKATGEYLVGGSSYCGDGEGADGSGGGGGPGGFTSNELSRSSVPLGPFTGYASILKGSRFLNPAQQLLEELCYMGRQIYAETIASDSTLLGLPPSVSLNGDEVVDDPVSCSDGGEQNGKKLRLLSMLHEVYRRYKHYYQLMQSVVASFESVAGLSHAAPFAKLALKTMSKHFRCLKNVITDQLQLIKSHGPLSYERIEAKFGNSEVGIQSKRPFHNAGFMDQPVWRSQRGLPERAVTVLRAWLFEHFLHPYPTDTDKIMLAKQTGLTRNQVSNWFINARVRLWKPMVEDIHMLETRQTQKSSQREEQSTNRLNNHLPISCPVECENASTSIPRIETLPSKLAGNDLTGTPMGGEGLVTFPYDNLSHHMGMSNAGGCGGVSLTLGLHQNVGFSETYTVNAAHGEGYVANGFAVQNR
ncbi:BEL1-like homeodomain 9 [Olea europaea subsp. europaea]|uniref:BEL1-like homeodomain 9 n=1 Tax=Olea europaea subsp. europaea TaxID=158383 RepID=A0A8S0TE50_OLEEU|nr:BEL1-like homeodomain 9 [Olea europaea subsp. europaea]